MAIKAAHEKIERIRFLQVPIDIVNPDDMETIIQDLSEDQGKHQIILLNLWDVLRTRWDKNFKAAVNDASLVLPVSKGIQQGIHFLYKKQAHRYNPFDFVIRLLGILEKHKKSLYILGNHPAVMQKIEKNLKDSFPGINLVGRYAGYFTQHMEDNVTIAIKKASPSLLLVGSGLKGHDKWIHKQKPKFNTGLYLWCADFYRVTAGKERRIPQKSFERGTYSLGTLLRKPWRVFRAFVYFYYLFLLLIYKVRKL
ncbi:MAG: WecB/TagA/CpsF family glycosyltransferase [Spirochaetia bacterium]